MRSAPLVNSCIRTWRAILRAPLSKADSHSDDDSRPCPFESGHPKQQSFQGVEATVDFIE